MMNPKTMQHLVLAVRQGEYQRAIQTVVRGKVKHLEALELPWLGKALPMAMVSGADLLEEVSP